MDSNMDSNMEIKERGIVEKDSDIFRLIVRTLGMMDKKIMEHSCKTAFIFAKMLKQVKKYSYKVIAQYTAIALLHDLGEYKLQSLATKKNQSSRNKVWSHSIYSYLYIKNFSPLGEMGEIVLYHHVHMRKFNEEQVPNCKEAVMLGFADRIAHALDEYDTKEALNDFFGKFGNSEIYGNVVIDVMKIALNTINDCNIPQEILEGNYEDELFSILDNLDLNEQDKRKYLELLMYAFDFQSDEAFLDTLRTICISEQIGDVMLISDHEKKMLSYGTLLYDIGKFAIPMEILRKPDKLTDVEMSIVRSHVSYTEYLLRDFFEPAVVHVAARHHERMDGSGYPRGIRAADLTLSERILAVADVVSALSADRSYRKALPKENILGILVLEAKEHKLCPLVVKVLLQQYDEIMEAVHTNVQKASKTFVVSTALSFNQLYMKLSQFS